MLGGYGLGVPVPRAATRNHTELDRYLRLEYSGRMNIETVLAEAACVSKKARMKGRNRLGRGIRATITSLRSVANGHRSKAPTSEV